jgi:hypothetical protein
MLRKGCLKKGHMYITTFKKSGFTYCWNSICKTWVQKGVHVKCFFLIRLWSGGVIKQCLLLCVGLELGTAGAGSLPPYERAEN